GFWRNRKADVECSALTFFTIEVYLAIVELHSPECLGQPDTRPALLCSVVEIEYSIPGLRAYSYAVVPDDYVGGPVVIRQRSHFQGSSLGHSLAPVDDDVE